MSIHYATISKGIKLFGKKDGFTSEWAELVDLMEIPELGGSADTIETTTLADSAHTYTQGLKNYGDSLSFKFLYSPTVWFEVGKLIDSPHARFKVVLPDSNELTCEFGGYASVKMDAVGVNAALTFTLTIIPNTEMAWSHGVAPSGE